MSDYFERVEGHLLDAVERNAAATVTPRPLRRSGFGRRRGAASARRWSRLPRRPTLLALLALLLLSGSAAGAVLVATERSRSLSGTVPAYQAEGKTISVAGSHYQIELAPSLTAGSIGWCETILYTGIAKLAGGSLGDGSCTATPALGSPLFAASGQRGNGISYVLSAPQVAAVRVAGKRIVLTRSSKQLPYGYRAAVFTVSKREFPPHGPLHLTALDEHGNVIPGGDRESPPQEQTRYWSAPLAAPKGACSIATIRDSGVKISEGALVTRMLADPGIIGHAFLSCEQIRLSVEGASNGEASRLTAAVLLDAKHPGGPPAMLPGVRPVSGQTGLYTAYGTDRPGPSSFVARRLPEAWLVVAGASEEALALQTLRDLSAGPIEPSAADAPPLLPSDAECEIGVRAQTGLTEVSERAWLIHGHPGRPIHAGSSTELLPCTEAHFYLEGWALTASVLYPIGASQPSAAGGGAHASRQTPAGALPSRTGRAAGAAMPRIRAETPNALAQRRPVPGEPDVFTIPGEYGLGEASIEHAGKLWIEVEGGSGPAQQEALLARLQASAASAKPVQPSLASLAGSPWMRAQRPLP